MPRPKRGSREQCARARQKRAINEKAAAFGLLVYVGGYSVSASLSHRRRSETSRCRRNDSNGGASVQGEERRGPQVKGARNTESGKRVRSERVRENSGEEERGEAFRR
eukprot:2079087-Pleurochrysis_carterae.AAC.2